MKFLTLHPLGYDERPHGHHPDLFKAVDARMAGMGHELLPISRTGEADVVFLDTGIWDLGGDGLSGRYSGYDWNALNLVLSNQIPVVFCDNFDHWGYPAFNGLPARECPWPGKNNWSDMRDLVQFQDHARFIVAVVDAGIPVLYFMRKMMISQQYPDWVHPWEYPLFDDHITASKEALWNRCSDVCFLANVSYPRATACVDLYRSGRIKFDGKMTGFSNRRLEFQEWLGRHYSAKMFMEADASLGSERPQRLMTVSAMLRVKSDHRLPFPRQDMVHMVEVGDYEGNLSNHDIDKIVEVVNDPDKLYEIYIQGAEHMRKHYSIDARSDYVIDIVQNFIKK